MPATYNPDSANLRLDAADIVALKSALGISGLTGAGSLATHAGTFTANGVTPVTVVDATVTANSVIVVTLKTVGGTVGAEPVPQTITAGVGFTIAGTALDTSVYNYRIFG